MSDPRRSIEALQPQTVLDLSIGFRNRDDVGTDRSRVFTDSERNKQRIGNEIRENQATVLTRKKCLLEPELSRGRCCRRLLSSGLREVTSRSARSSVGEARGAVLLHYHKLEVIRSRFFQPISVLDERRCSVTVQDDAEFSLPPEKFLIDDGFLVENAWGSELALMNIINGYSNHNGRGRWAVSEIRRMTSTLEGK
ncbi:hypothetical protein DY000_02028314 [Brassica cretica]|uniref:Uncharacterized protein n=1 Tax=Brassica cretica TaxID=69181 RepID=A0ABQ7DQJ5_BRACR|nr:hypothetical protein DY000_02028314 [Brassica cretica]